MKLFNVRLHDLDYVAIDAIATYLGRKKDRRRRVTRSDAARYAIHKIAHMLQKREGESGKRQG